ncbi:MAG: hypothetical protein QOJ79_2899 [Actinomycetota bacterium]|jgi:hypothetical protein|nr:hypothetical protein [Actinomycetota bacterium]
MTVRRVLLAAALAVGAAAATSLTALSASGPASAGCGTVGVPGHDTYQVCNPVIDKVEDLLR